VLKSILAAPVIRCDQVQWAFLGLSMAGWNALISLTSAGAIAWLTLKR
jgi:disulfide bond formation protein DsbB